MAQNKCKLIVIDGLDGSGKATQTKLLSDRLNRRGFKARTISFPDYDSDSSALVRMYLGGRLGSSPDDVNAYAASSFYAVDRVASYINSWRKDCEEFDYIIADRYTTSNIIHQMAKVDEAERDSYIEWLFDFEYHRLELPAPDMVIFLDVDPAISQKLIYGRYQGDESKKDIHERDFAYLMRCRSSALYAIERLGWVRIDCTEDGEMRSIEDIGDSILSMIVD
ncbi:MAG: deoxynucleoside kinase [Ruminococcus sp.]|nr:deoxynucleoside kinase [Ruminococcus sp.]